MGCASRSLGALAGEPADIPRGVAMCLDGVSGRLLSGRDAAASRLLRRYPRVLG